MQNPVRPLPRYLSKCVVRGSVVLPLSFVLRRRFGKETSIELVIIGEDGILQSICDQPAFGTIRDFAVIPWSDKFYARSQQTQGKDLLAALSDSGKLSFLTFCNEMHRFFPLTHVQLSNPGNSRYQLGRMLAVDSSDIIDKQILYPLENEGSFPGSFLRQSISGTIWSMCFISRKSSLPSKEHNPVVAIILNRKGALLNELVLMGWHIRDHTLSVISVYVEAGPLAHDIVQVPHSNGYAFLFRAGDVLLMDLRDAHNPCCVYRTTLNFLPTAVEGQNFVEEPCKVHDVE